MLLEGNLPPKINSYSNIFPRNYLSYIFESQLLPFAFSRILGDPFMVSPAPFSLGDLFMVPPPHHLKYGEEGLFFLKKMLFMGDKFCGENL